MLITSAHDFVTVSNYTRAGTIFVCSTLKLCAHFDVRNYIAVFPIMSFKE